MDRLISLQAAIDAVRDRMGKGETNIGDTFIECFEMILNALPSAQPEIIRCRECKHGVDYYREGDCYCSNPKWGLKYFGGSWEFYCADAERRTDA